MPDVSDRRVPQRKDTLTHEVTDTDEVVIYDGSGPQLLVVSDIAAGVWLLIDGARSIDDITAGILNHVEAERATVARDVIAFLGQLGQRELIVWQGAT